MDSCQLPPCRQNIEEDKVSSSLETVKIVPTKQELKPCPFCGGEAQLQRHFWAGEDTGEWSVVCMTGPCNVVPRTFADEDKRKVITWWNRRTNAK